MGRHQRALRGPAALAIVAVAAVAFAATAGGGGEPVAILIPARTACTGTDSTITLGVRYTNNPPGPRSFELTLRGPRGKRLLERSGVATKTWRIWHYDLADRGLRPGVYRSTYKLSWGTEVFRTRLRRCRA